MRRGVFEPNDTDHRDNSALFGGTVSDSCDALAFLTPHPNNFPKKDRPPVCLGLNRCGYSVCHAALLRICLLNRRHDQPGGRLADGEGGGAVFHGGPSDDSYLCRFIGVDMVALAQSIALSTRILGPAIIATVIILIIVGVVWDAHR